jgi:thiol:disulfide interchange protein DsbD
MSVAVIDAASVAIDYAPAADHFLYRDKFAFRVHEPATAIITSIELPSGEVKDDPFFGRTEIFAGKVRAVVRFQRTSAAPLVLDVSYQGCNARIGVCYPPIEKRLRLELPPPLNLRQRFQE